MSDSPGCRWTDDCLWISGLTELVIIGRKGKKKNTSPGLHASVCRTADSAMEADYSGLCQQFVSVQSVPDNHNAAMFVTHLYYIVIGHSLKRAGLAPMETVNCLEMSGVCLVMGW